MVGDRTNACLWLFFLIHCHVKLNKTNILADTTIWGQQVGFSNSFTEQINAVLLDFLKMYHGFHKNIIIDTIAFNIDNN